MLQSNDLVQVNLWKWTSEMEIRMSDKKITTDKISYVHNRQRVQYNYRDLIIYKYNRLLIILINRLLI